jgi:hypothetical protein
MKLVRGNTGEKNKVITGLGARHTSTQSRAVQKNERAGTDAKSVQYGPTRWHSVLPVNGFHLKIIYIGSKI